MSYQNQSFNIYSESLKAQDILSRTDLILPTELMLANELRTCEEDTLWLSSEIHQNIKAYKIRGAANAIIQMSMEDRSLSLVAASAGNHAQAVALMARELNLPATIVMPSNTPDFKVGRVDSFASKKTKVILEGDTYDDAEEYAMYLSDKLDLTMIHPFNDFKVIAGQATWALEIMKYLNNLDNIYVPVGGGGLIAGVASVIKNISPKTRIVAVEPSGAASLTKAYMNNKPSKLSSIDTFVDGASVKLVGELPFSILKDLVDEVITIENNETIESTKILNDKFYPRMVEFAGALSLAGYLKDIKRREGDSSLCLVTGGNLSQERYKRYLNL